ncbi:MAG: ArsR family transcriptional regulator [delta proteobacterium ML8_F1]|nr:MAG: ArsR family transcriptional regulator [delta proteobacterium ML8_F1]
MRKKILVIEDDRHIVELIRFNLEANDYEVETSFDGKEGLMKALGIRPDLIILDIMIPEIDGLGVLNRLRVEESTKRLPIIMLTAKSSEMDKIVGLEIGADDYITKPFSINELIARVKAHLRRTQREQEHPKPATRTIAIKNLVVDLETYEVTKSGTPVKLSLKEFELLKTLVENQGKVLTRNQLLDEIWGYDFYGETRTVDVHIRHLRSKLDDDEEESLIDTVRGIGYKIK